MLNYTICYKNDKFLQHDPVNIRVPTQTGKPGKMGRHFPVREKSGNFEQTGKVRENHTKYWKNIREFQKNVMLSFSDI